MFRSEFGNAASGIGPSRGRFQIEIRGRCPLPQAFRLHETECSNT